MNAAENTGERRSERRVPCGFTFSVTRVSGEGSLASAIDLSPAGMRFQAVGHTISQDDRLLVQFTMKDSTYSFCGRPLRIVEPAPFTQEVAVLFQAVDPRTRTSLREDISCHLAG